jgi:hypothetical protein
VKTYRVLVCGDRHWNDDDKIWHVLDAYLARIGPGMFLINGGASGADDSARRWAVDRRVDHITLYAKWELEGKAAGPIRNSRMKRLKPKRCLAFHSDFKNSRGTKDMVTKCQRDGIKSKVFT